MAKDTVPLVDQLQELNQEEVLGLYATYICKYPFELPRRKFTIFTSWYCFLNPAIEY